MPLRGKVSHNVSSSEEATSLERVNSRRSEVWSTLAPGPDEEAEYVPDSSWRGTWLGAAAIGLALTATATVIGLVLEHHLRRAEIAMMHLLGILAVAMRSPVGPALAAAALSVLSFDYFFIPPRFAFAWTDAKSSITLLSILVTGGVVSYVNQTLRRDRQLTALRERTTAALNRLLSHLGAARTLQHATDIASRELSQWFGTSVSILVAPSAFFSLQGLASEDKNDAEECWRTLSPVVRGPRPGPDAVWVPIVGTLRPLGVLGMRAMSGTRSSECLSPVTASRCAQIIANALERVEHSSLTEAAETRGEIEQLRDSLLRAVAHDIRTPLASIVAAGALLAERDSGWDSQRRGAAARVVEESQGLLRLTENLLELARLRTGQLFVRRESVPVDELLECAVRRVRASPGQRLIKVEVPDDCPMISADWRLVELVIVNLLEDALKRANAGIEISVSYDGDSVTMVVDDRDQRDAAPRSAGVAEPGRHGSSGKGGAAGLALTRTLVESHGGMIWIEEVDGGGIVARVRFSRAQDTAVL